MTTENKIVTENELLSVMDSLRETYRIAFTNGCFDLLHLGHVHYLEAAKQEDRQLIVGLNSDKSVRAIKGNDRPIVPERGRARVIAGLQCVDFVCLFDSETPLELIQRLRPDILIKGEDWKNKGIVGEDFVKKNGGQIEYLPFQESFSTTSIIETILRKCQK